MSFPDVQLEANLTNGQSFSRSLTWIFNPPNQKKSLFFAKLIAEFLVEEDVAIEEDSFPDEHIFLISTSDPWYGYILVFLQTLKCPATFSWEERSKLLLHAKNYLIIGDTLYRRGVDSVLHKFLTQKKTESVLNDSHSRACGVIYLDQQRPRIFCVPVIFIPRSLNIVWKP